MGGQWEEDREDYSKKEPEEDLKENAEEDVEEYTVSETDEEDNAANAQSITRGIIKMSSKLVIQGNTATVSVIARPSVSPSLQHPPLARYHSRSNENVLKDLSPSL